MGDDNYMKLYKVILLMVLFMSLYALVMVPMSEGSFPAWLNTDIMLFLMMVAIIAILLVLIGK